jgi:hypothetical protein
LIRIIYIIASNCYMKSVSQVEWGVSYDDLFAEVSLELVREENQEIIIFNKLVSFSFVFVLKYFILL